MTDSATVLLDLTRWINDQARSTIEEDGEHAAMFFLLLPDGRVRPELFEEVEERPVGEHRARNMADAVRATGANAIAFVSEAWGAPEDSIPDGGGAGDSPEAGDLLLVAALDRDDNLVVFETAVHRAGDRSVTLGDSSRALSGYQVAAFDSVRAVWRK